MEIEELKKEYTGVWIPAEVMECEQLNPLDKLVYGEIAGFRICFASNAWIAARIRRSERTARDSINKLIRLGLVENLGFDGHHRKLRVATFVQADWQNLAMQHGEKLPHNNKVENKDNINSETRKNKPVEKSEYGNHEVNALLELWEHETGLTANVAKANRLAAWNLLRRRGFDGAKKVVELCGRAIKSGDRYAPRVASFRDLQGQYEKLSKLEAWEKRQRPEAASGGVSLAFYRQNNREYEEISDDERKRVLEAMKKAREERKW